MDFVLISVVTVVTVFAYFAYNFYFGPQHQIRKFTQQAKSLGYRVKVYPFKFMQFFLIPELRKNQRDLEAFKNELCEYDLVVGNMIDSLAIVVANQSLLKDTFNQLPKLPKNPFITEYFRKVGGGGLVFSEGEAWKRKRKIISSVFHFGFLNEMIPVVEEITDAKIMEIDDKLQKGEKQVNLADAFREILSSVVTKSFFGTDMNEYLIEGKPYCIFYTEFLKDVASQGANLSHYIFGEKAYDWGLTTGDRALKKKLNIMLEIGKQVIQKELEKIKKGQVKQKNMLTTFYEKNLLTKQGEKSNPQQYTPFELVGEFLIFFAAGTDTTSTVLNVIMHYLNQQEELNQKIIEETVRVGALSSLTPEKLKEMKWLDAIFNEALRLNGPVSYIAPRKATEQIVLQQFLSIPKGTSVTMIPMLIQYKDQHFPNPKEFVPSRWFSDSEQNASQKKIEPFTFIAFGGGERNCIGQYLARIQMKVILTKLVNRYEIKSMAPLKMRASFTYMAVNSQYELQHRKTVKESLIGSSV